VKRTVEQFAIVYPMPGNGKKLTGRVSALERRVEDGEATNEVLVDRVTDIDVRVIGIEQKLTVLVDQGLPAILNALQGINDGVEKLAANMVVVAQPEVRLKALEEAVFKKS
jgi:hypothetical protein